MTPMQCEACASTETKSSFVKRGFAHRECRQCGLLFVSTPPSREESRAAHTPGREASGEPLSITSWEGSHRHLDRTWAGLLDMIRTTAGDGPLLDVGCGGGHFLAFAARAGWADLLGLEPAAAPVARRATTARIIEAPLEDTALPSSWFAGIVAWDVIEHVPHLRRFLKEARRLLRPGGVIVVATVHRGGPALRVFGRLALVVHPPEHLRYFTQRSLRAALTEAGLGVLRLWTQDVYLREWTRAWTRADGPSAVEREAHRRAYDRFTTSGVLGRAVAAANVILRATGLGDELVAVARRPPDLAGP